MSRLLHPRTAIVLHDLLMVWAAWTAVRWIRYTMWPDAPALELFSHQTIMVMACQGLILSVTGLYRGIWRFASLPDLWNILKAAILGALLILLVLFLVNRLEGVPRSVFLMYPVLLTFLLGGPRLLYRVWKDHRIQFHARPGRSQRVLILGAGSAGEVLARDMRSEGEYYPVGFLDDDPSLRGRKLRGLSVFGALDKVVEIVAERAIDKVVIAMPSADSDTMLRVVRLCAKAGVPYQTVPRLQDVVSGRLMFSQLKDVAIEDLLGRDPVRLDWHAIGRAVAEKSVVVTGGGGSIGSELCRQIARLSPRRLTVVERSEFNLYRIEMELRQKFPDLLLRAVLADVGDRQAMDRILNAHPVDMLFHTAAYKHVPLLEEQVREAARNNVLGTACLAAAADRAGVRRFVLVSTDKAVNPANIMGVTKRAAEMVCLALAQRSKTRFLTVRFGNVLDSAGSVVPLFREQIANGGPVTVTDPEVTRFFMTIAEACQLILEVSAVGDSGQIYVLDMGTPVRIQELAEQMIRLAGREVGRDIEIAHTGLRPGEKLFEELFHESEACVATDHDRVLRARHRSVDDREVSSTLGRLYEAVQDFDEATILRLLEKLVPEHTSTSGEQRTTIHLIQEDHDSVSTAP